MGVQGPVAGVSVSRGFSAVVSIMVCVEVLFLEVLFLKVIDILCCSRDKGLRLA